MEIIYTRHAKGRMRWRKISEQDVERAIAAPDSTEQIASNKMHYFKTVDSQLIRVTAVYENDHYVIITAIKR